MSDQRKTRIAWTIIFVGAMIILAGGIIRAPIEVPLGIVVGALMAVAVTSHPDNSRINATVILSVIMVITIMVTGVVNLSNPVSPSFFWGMLGLGFGWFPGLVFSWD